MLTQNDVSSMTISLISDLDQQFSRAADALRERFDFPSSASVRCVKYRDNSQPLIEAYLESDVSPKFTLSFHLDVQLLGNHWAVSRSIRRDGVTSELLRGFPDLETSAVESLSPTVLFAAAEGLREFKHLHEQQLTA